MTRAELLRRGSSRAGIARAVERGDLEPLGRGVYRSGEAAPASSEWWVAVAAACAQRPGTVVTGQAAAALRSLDGFAPGVPVTLATSPGASGRGPGVRRLQRLVPIADVAGLPCTGIEETLLDAGADLVARPGCAAATELLDPMELVELAVEDALRRGLTTVATLHDVVAAANPRRPGRRLLKMVLRRRRTGLPPTESYLETRCVQVLRRAGLPEFDRQVVLYDDAGFIGRVDLVRSGVVLEVVGRSWHLDRFDADHRRYARLAAAGHVVLPFTFDDIERRADHVTRTTLAALSAQQDHAGRQRTPRRQ